MTGLSVSDSKSGISRLPGRYFRRYAWDTALGLVILCWEGALVFTANAAVMSERLPKPDIASRLGIPSATLDQLGYSVTHWTVAHGLPGLAVTCLAQTSDGYLWCGTYSGLARYDGARFKVFDSVGNPALEGVQIAGLYSDSAGRLWIGGSAGELVVYANGRFSRITAQDGLPLHQKEEEGEDHQGDFWIEDVSDSRFYRYAGKRFEPVAKASVPGPIIDRFEISNGGIKSVMPGYDRPAGTLASFTRKPALPTPFNDKSESNFSKFFYLRDGDLAALSSKGIYALRHARWNLLLDFGRDIEARPIGAVEDWSDNFWVSFAGLGLVFCQPSGHMKLVQLPGLVEHSSVRALMLGREGNLWVASDDGLYRIRREAFQSRLGPRGMWGRAAKAVIEDSSGNQWILYDDGVAHMEEGGWEYLPNPDSPFRLRTGAPCRDGGVLLGYMNRRPFLGGYVEKITAAGERERIGSVKYRIRDLLERKTGEIWVATDDGIWRLKGQQFVRVPITGESRRYRVCALVEDHEGRLVAGVSHRGLYRQERGGVWRRLTTTNDLGSDLIVSLYVDKEGTLWAATGDGLARWNHEGWYAFSGSEGALPRQVRGITSDRLGNLWISSRIGVIRVKRSLLNAVADGSNAQLDSSWFDHSDGLPSAVCLAGPHAIHRSVDGRIWIATAGGVAVVNPEECRERRARQSAPAVQIQSVMVDNRLLLELDGRNGTTQGARIVVPPGTHRLEFRYAAITLTASRRTRFRYELEGADKHGMNAGEQRSVVYHGLRPGHYRFHVIAANKYGLWNNTGAAVAILVRPYWWQTLRFQIGAGILLLGLLWSSRSLRLRQLRRQRARREEFTRRLMESQEAERQRVARELHDGLGQDLMLIKNRAQLTLRRVGDESLAKEQLNEVSALASRAIKDARAIMCNLRPLELDRLGLTDALEAMMDSVRSSADLDFESRINDIDNLWTPDQEIHVYRIVQECLNNAVKHAQATRIDVLVSRADSSVRIQVCDNGRGFSPDEVPSATGTQGFGLAGMRERVRFLGGRVEFDSAPGAGTRVQLLLPVHDEERS